MENIEIVLGGITRTPSDKSSQNGQLEDAINLENVAGEMRPVYPPKKIGNKSDQKSEIKIISVCRLLTDPKRVFVLDPQNRF